MIDILAFQHSVANARQQAIELHQRVMADQRKLTEQLAASLAAVERSQELLAAREARLASNSSITDSGAPGVVILDQEAAALILV